MSERLYRWAAYGAFDVFGQGIKIGGGDWPIPPAVGDVLELGYAGQLRIERFRVLSRTWVGMIGQELRLTVEKLSDE